MKRGTGRNTELTCDRCGHRAPRLYPGSEDADCVTLAGEWICSVCRDDEKEKERIGEVKHPKINVIVWKPDYAGAWTFVRRPVPTDPHFLVVRVNGVEVDYSSCGIGLNDCVNGLPRDAREITLAEANALPMLVRGE